MAAAIVRGEHGAGPGWSKRNIVVLNLHQNPCPEEGCHGDYHADAISQTSHAKSRKNGAAPVCIPTPVKYTPLPADEQKNNSLVDFVPGLRYYRCIAFFPQRDLPSSDAAAVQSSLFIIIPNF